MVWLTMEIPAPSGWLYANEMVDHPYTRYTRYGITDDVRGQIIPTLTRQER